MSETTTLSTLQLAEEWSKAIPLPAYKEFVFAGPATKSCSIGAAL